MGMLYHLSDWIFRMLIINLLWFIFNIPVVFFLIHLLLIKNTNGFIAIGLIVLAIMPFLFFPATTGMFSVVRNCVLVKQSSKIVRAYWKAYKEKYIISMIGGIVIVIIWLIVIVDYYVFTTYISASFKYLYLFIFIYLLVFSLHFFSVVVHFEATLFNDLKNALFITFGSPILSIILAILNIVIVYVSFNYMTFIIPLFIGSLVALVSFFGFYRVYLTIQK